VPEQLLHLPDILPDVEPNIGLIYWNTH